MQAAEDNGQVSRAISLNRCCWREGNQFHVTQLKTKMITVELSWETNSKKKKKVSLILEPAALGGSNPCFDNSGLSDMDYISLFH